MKTERSPPRPFGTAAAPRMAPPRLSGLRLPGGDLGLASMQRRAEIPAVIDECDSRRGSCGSLAVAGDLSGASRMGRLLMSPVVVDGRRVVSDLWRRPLVGAKRRRNPG
jgi:hypothetical protein